jgi:hypothetical protein
MQWRGIGRANLNVILALGQGLLYFTGALTLASRIPLTAYSELLGARPCLEHIATLLDVFFFWCTL